MLPACVASKHDPLKTGAHNVVREMFCAGVNHVQCTAGDSTATHWRLCHRRLHMVHRGTKPRPFTAVHSTFAAEHRWVEVCVCARCPCFDILNGCALPSLLHQVYVCMYVCMCVCVCARAPQAHRHALIACCDSASRECLSAYYCIAQRRLATVCTCGLTRESTQGFCCSQHTGILGCHTKCALVIVCVCVCVLVLLVYFATCVLVLHQIEHSEPFVPHIGKGTAQNKRHLQRHGNAYANLKPAFSST